MSTPPVYRERLLPGPWWWIVIAALVAMVAIAYGAALGTSVGIISAIALTGIAVAGLWFGSPRVLVDASGLRCARATLPSTAIGDSRVLVGPELQSARRGQDADVPLTAYVLAPSWAPESAVAVHVLDPGDPHPVWLVATRHPEKLAQALADLRQ